MHGCPLPRIIAADRVLGDLLIAFDDDRTALFSAAFLYEAIPQARQAFEGDLEEHPGVDINQRNTGARPTARELMQKLSSPLEVLANLTFLTLEDAEFPKKVNLYMRMAEEQMETIRQIASNLCPSSQATPPPDSLTRVA